MAFPNTGISYPADTLATVAWQSVSKNLTNLINAGGEILIGELSRRGRVFVTPDVEHLVTPVMHADPGDTTYVGFKPDNYGAGATLANSSADFLSSARYTYVAKSDNVSWGQEHPGGTDLDFHMAIAEAKAKVILQQEESLLLLGNTTADGDAPVTVAPYEGDAKFDATNFKPMNLRGIYCAGTATPGDGGTSEIAEEFAGIIGSDSAQWIPQVQNGTASGANLLSETETLLAACFFSGGEQANYGITGRQVWQKYNALLRAESALAQPLSTDLVKNPSQAVMVGGVPLVWSRMLSTADALNDYAASASDITYPIFFLNLNSLRLNMPHAGGAIEGLPFVRRIGAPYLVPTATNWSYRLSWKRQYSLDGGRRSFGYINKVTL
jgi:hypothetical protein